MARNDGIEARRGNRDTPAPVPLDPFDEREQSGLIGWGRLMMDVILRSYVVAEVPAPDAYPVPAVRVVAP